MHRQQNIKKKYIFSSILSRNISGLTPQISYLVSLIYVLCGYKLFRILTKYKAATGWMVRSLEAGGGESFPKL